MNVDIIKFFTAQRHIFGICPRSGRFFRLSDCRIFLKEKPALDWMEKLHLQVQKLDEAEIRLDAKKEGLRERAREKGRQLARLAVRKIDPIFTPRKLNPDDAKVIFHPIDYIVFNGMKNAETIKNIVLLDRQARQANQRSAQRSIERVIERGNYEWRTLRVREDGKIDVE